MLTCILPTLFHMKRFIDNTTIWCIAAVFPKDLWLMLALLLKKTLSFSSNHCRSVLERAGHSASCSFTRGWAAKLSLCPPGRCFLTVSGSCCCCLLFSVAAGPGVASFTSGMGKILINYYVIYWSTNILCIHALSINFDSDWICILMDDKIGEVMLKVVP